MKGLADKPSYTIELLEGGVTLEDVIDGHICEQTLVSFIIAFSNCGSGEMRYPNYVISIPYLPNA